MTLLEKLHSEYYTQDGDLVLYRCTECGYTTMSIGGLHAHVEQHWPYFKWLAHLLPWFADRGDWMEYTQVLAVRDTEGTDLSEVKGL